MTCIDKVALIYCRGGRVLSSRSKGKDVYYLPGGKREGDETDAQTLTREIREELSVAIRADSIRYYGTFTAQAHGHSEGILVQMTCYQADFDGEPMPSAEIAELVWLRYADREKSSPVDRIIFDDLREKGLLE